MKSRGIFGEQALSRCVNTATEDTPLPSVCVTADSKVDIGFTDVRFVILGMVAKQNAEARIRMRGDRLFNIGTVHLGGTGGAVAARADHRVDANHQKVTALIEEVARRDGGGLGRALKVVPRIAVIIRQIKEKWPDCAVTLSVGEWEREAYQEWFDAGADRYLLRHETADPALYRALHPGDLSLENRMRCLRDLKDIGYQTGCGFMVGSPYQTTADIARDLEFIADFKPDMCGIGPFIPHAESVFADFPAGTVELTCYLLSIIRLIHPPVLLPATTALGTIHPEGRELGILSGANVVMPNLSPPSVRKKYMLYNDKVSDGAESAQSKAELCRRMASIGYEVVTARGDVKK